ncbi:acyl-CoA thioesterase [Riemerella anatipestifer]|uniref:acyl-CoA thioesterase n=1 Tax=Riemerella anatipestifer TaxID=34085 RepID=UPI0035B6A05A
MKPARYDEVLEIHTFIKKLPDGVRIVFDYEIYNPKGEKITEASTTLFFLNAKTGRIMPCPDFLLDLMKPYF